MSFHTRRYALARAGLLCATGASLALAVLPAFAAEQTVEIEEVIVTVRQRAESVKDVPGAVTTFSEKDIEATGIERARDFVYQTPGVSIVNAAEVADSQVNIRGINGARDAETNYALIIDGILMTNPAALNREYVNLKDIEVLKGPQGALYGRNAAAGAIIINTRKPGDVLGGDIKASIAQDNTYVLSGDINGPLTDTIGLSVYGDFRDSDGYYSNQYYKVDVPGSDDKNIDNFKSWDLGARMVWTPNDRLTVDSKLRYGKVDASSITFNSTFQIPSLVGLLENGFGFPADVAAYAYENVNSHQFQFNNNIESFNNQESLEFSAKADYDLGWADLTSWALYSDIQNDLGADGTSAAFQFFANNAQCQNTTAALNAQGYPLPPPQVIGPTPAFSVFGAYTPTSCDGTQYQLRDQKDYSIEVRLASKTDQRLRWLGGAYYLNIDRHVGVNTGIDLGFGVVDSLYVDRNGPQGNINPTEQLANDKFTSDVYAGFGQLAYDVTDAIEASLALRYDREERHVRNLVPTPAEGATTEYINTCDPGGGNTGGDPINPGLCDGPITPKSATFDKWEPKAALTWDFTENQTAYTSVGVGFKSGGFNNQGSQATINSFINCQIGIGTFAGTTYNGQTCGTSFGSFDAVNIQDQYADETSTSYEAGLKSSWFDRRVRTEVAAYHVDVHDMQFFEFFVGGFGLLRVVSNIDKVEINGVEGSVVWSVNEWLELNGGINLINSEIKKDKARPDSVGNTSPYTPDYNYNLGARVNYPMTPTLRFVGSLEVSGLGDTWFHTIQDNQRPTGFSEQFGIGPGQYNVTKRDGFSLVNMRAGVSGGDWTLVGFLDNAFDTDYLEEVIPAPEFGGSFIHPGSERRFGVEATYKF